ncbi:MULTISPECIES: dTDP-4-dehydrorhamnose 3,5-epimerase family protein [Streptomyces]|uniref:dTDP-4-keto-6-deoxy-D-glucose epimerase n=3 Tax=Streptomyces TaxID=1883 RepID=A0A3M8EQN6_9ACTN|nr:MULTISPECIES: dTDP-4-dehydrorhamnose 3,5-epimerase family protein [Streptomyces]AAD41825.1 NDP-hexose 3,5- (or5-) epimerase TylCVII [Streptomyces fradiae]KNE79473.1 dTDP-4-dehydrorhamnose 3,5-epimerase [Streptomyces fradiae]OFA40095.1 dTDP-4-dehydrorhamnose 3,5-epimerase [Streptomyces fradiae]PQM19468.1 dTDP-4-keto-6-deoxy-D-glucose epimerase [Streptomyces xinghaiensis]RKM89892.1 dTDP-4-keto-6-deoxy-D-glucose epimerase [Streptomyces xinghaiensis]
MIITETRVRDAYRITPEPIPDHRGSLYESLRYETLRRATGHAIEIRQVNHTVNRRNTLRGIHGTTVPPGQGKIVTCVRGAARTMVVDLRVGSPTFGGHDVVGQDAESGVAVYLPDGLGLGYVALADDTCMNYLYTREYTPGMIIDIDALDPGLGLPWNLTEPPVRSERDAAAPSLAEAAAAGTLPGYEQCLRAYPAM